MQKRLKEELSRALTPRGIVIEDVLLKAVQVPFKLPFLCIESTSH